MLFGWMPPPILKRCFLRTLMKRSGFISFQLFLLFLLITLSVEVIAQGLPPGPGWHSLPNTAMTSVCVGNISNGMYTDSTMTSTTAYDFNCNEVIPWSGAAADDQNHRLILWGGGHSDYAGDEVFVLNLNGTPAWQLFTKPTTPIPNVGDGKNWEGLNPYYVRLSDGGTYKPGASPASRHTYNGLQYIPSEQALFVRRRCRKYWIFFQRSLDARYGNGRVDYDRSALFPFTRIPYQCLQSQQWPRRYA